MQLVQRSIVRLPRERHRGGAEVECFSTICSQYRAVEDEEAKHRDAVARLFLNSTHG